jgi:membrane protease YdiL (CAAX protease family)
MTSGHNSGFSRIPKDIGWFLGIVYLLSGIAMYKVIEAGDFGVSGGIYAILGMWSPGIAAFIVALAFRIPIRSFGWGWGKTRYQLISFLIPLGYISLNYAIVWGFGLGEIADRPVGEMLIFAATAILPWNTMVYFVVLGEEIGWSGYLVPRLARSMSINAVAALRGVIWSTWHIPLILGGVYGPTTLPVWYLLCTFLVMAFCVSFVYTWMRLLSGSLWTGVLLHASHNKFIQGVFPRFTTDTGSTAYFQDEFSIILVVIMIAIAGVLWKRGQTQAADVRIRAGEQPAS